jgi:hypothetical protein
MPCSMIDISEDPTASVITRWSGVTAAAGSSETSVHSYQRHGVTAISTLHTVSYLRTKRTRSKSNCSSCPPCLATVNTLNDLTYFFCSAEHRLASVRSAKVITHAANLSGHDTLQFYAILPPIKVNTQWHNEGVRVRVFVGSAKNIKIKIFWDVTPCCLVCRYKCIGGTCSLYRQCEIFRKNVHTKC